MYHLKLHKTRQYYRVLVVRASCTQASTIGYATGLPETPP